MNIWSNEASHCSCPARSIFSDPLRSVGANNESAPRMKPSSPHPYDSAVNMAALALLQLLQALLGFAQAANHFY